MKKFKLAICLSVYNGKNHIARCLNSLLANINSSTQIILVDDGSTDGSCDILKSFSNDDKIKVICIKTNKGISFARYTSVINSNSEYIAFLDIDDELLKNPMEIMCDIDNNINYDIIDFSAIDLDNNFIKSFYKREQVINGKDYCNDFFYGKEIPHPLWLRVFKTDLFFPNPFTLVYELHEDSLTLPILLNRAKSIYISHEVLVVYNNKNSESITKKDINLKTQNDLFIRDYNYSKSKWNNLVLLKNHSNEFSESKYFLRYLIQLEISFGHYNSALKILKEPQSNYERKNPQPLKYRVFLNIGLFKLNKSLLTNLFLFTFGLKLTIFLSSLWYFLKVFLKKL